jgi:uncharacterized small protein (DUF1192 family)
MRDESAGDGAGPHTMTEASDPTAALVHEMRNALNTISVAAQLIDSKIALIAGLINRLEAEGDREPQPRKASDGGAAQGGPGDGAA